MNFMHQFSSLQLNAQTAKAQQQLGPITRISHLCLNFKLSGSYLLSHNDRRSDQLNVCRTYFNLGGKLFPETCRIWLVLFWKACSWYCLGAVRRFWWNQPCFSVADDRMSALGFMLRDTLVGLWFVRWGMLLWSARLNENGSWWAMKTLWWLWRMNIIFSRAWQDWDPGNLFMARLTEVRYLYVVEMRWFFSSWSYIVPSSNICSYSFCLKNFEGALKSPATEALVTIRKFIAIKISVAEITVSGHEIDSKRRWTNPQGCDWIGAGVGSEPLEMHASG